MKHAVFSFFLFVVVGLNSLGAVKSVSAIYEVPATADLVSYSRFPINVDVVTDEQNGTLTIRYTLPEEITGNNEALEFVGQQKKNGQYILEGIQGKAKCLGTSLCEIEYVDSTMNFNWTRSEELIRATSTSEQQLTARLQVACSFQSDPFGVIHFEESTIVNTTPVFQLQKLNCSQIK